jgi:hypothetical protein
LAEIFEEFIDSPLRLPQCIGLLLDGGSNSGTAVTT